MPIKGHSCVNTQCRLRMYSTNTRVTQSQPVQSNQPSLVEGVGDTAILNIHNVNAKSKYVYSSRY